MKNTNASNFDWDDIRPLPPRYCWWCGKALQLIVESSIRYIETTGEPYNRDQKFYRCPDWELGWPPSRHANHEHYDFVYMF